MPPRTGKNEILRVRLNTQKLVLRHKIITYCAQICMYRRHEIFLIFFFCDMNFLVQLGIIAMQINLFILQKRPQSITNFTKLVSNKDK